MDPGSFVESPKLEFLDEMVAPWFLALIESVTNVKHLSLDFVSDTFALRDQSGELCHCPRLQKLTLLQVTFPQAAFVAFLRLRCDSLMILDWKELEVKDGSWVEPLQIIQQMPKLKTLRMAALYFGLRADELHSHI
jgi:hypothetical protein